MKNQFKKLNLFQSDDLSKLNLSTDIDMNHKGALSKKIECDFKDTHSHEESLNIETQDSINYKNFVDCKIKEDIYLKQST